MCISVASVYSLFVDIVYAAGGAAGDIGAWSVLLPMCVTLDVHWSPLTAVPYSFQQTLLQLR